MPEISRFFGIKIFMFNTSREHNPPHFHATYQGYKASFDFNGELKEGYMPKKQIKLISAWAIIHKNELVVNWKLAKKQGNLFWIEPLR